MTPEELDALREQLVALGDDTETRARRIVHGAHWLAFHVPDLLRLLAYIDELQSRVSDDALIKTAWRIADALHDGDSYEDSYDAILPVLRERMR
jgi:hypothetical protein